MDTNNEKSGEHTSTVEQLMQDVLASAAAEMVQEESDELTPEGQLRDCWEDFGGDGLADDCWQVMCITVSELVAERATTEEAEFGVMHQMVARQMIDEAIAYLQEFCAWTPDMIHDAVADHVPGMTVRQRDALRKKAAEELSGMKDAAAVKLLNAAQAA